MRGIIVNLMIRIADVMKHPSWSLLEHRKCGNSNSDRIIGGKNASLGAYPWIARIGYGNPGAPDLSYRCGGTLINKLYVITAAHCVMNLPEKYINNILVVLKRRKKGIEFIKRHFFDRTDQRSREDLFISLLKDEARLKFRYLRGFLIRKKIFLIYFVFIIMIIINLLQFLYTT